MKRFKISQGGQISVPSAVRNRWQTRTVITEDHGDYLVVRPAPDDPVEAARGALADYKGPSVDEMKRIALSEERSAERRREND